MRILIGADPELFLIQNNKVVSAHNAIPGTKEHPYKVKGGAVQVDGMALEYNIHPSRSRLDFVNNNVTVMNNLKDMLPHGSKFSFDAVNVFGREVIDGQPPEAVILGCEPDFNAYKGGDIQVPPNANVDFRTASGHIHIGWRDDNVNPLDPVHMADCCMVIKELDRTLGCLTLERTNNKIARNERLRRSLYGMAGSFRPKEYGVEYRVLSNSWLKTPERMSFVYNVVKRVMKNINNPNRLLLSRGPYKTEYHINQGFMNRREVGYRTADLLRIFEQEFGQYAAL